MATASIKRRLEASIYKDSFPGKPCTTPHGKAPRHEYHEAGIFVFRISTECPELFCEIEVKVADTYRHIIKAWMQRCRAQ
jgi:hypothetical protein